MLFERTQSDYADQRTLNQTFAHADATHAPVTISEPLPSNLGGEMRIMQAMVRPDALQSDVPIYFHGGVKVKNPNATYLQYIAENHRRNVFTVTYDQKRSPDTHYWVSDTEGKHRQLMHRDALQYLPRHSLGSVVAQSQIAMAADIKDAADHLGAEQIDVVGQSLAALRMQALLAQYPDRVKNMVLGYPVGMINPPMKGMLSNAVTYAKKVRELKTEMPYEETIDAWVSGIGQNIIDYEKQQSNSTQAAGNNMKLSYHGADISAVRKRADAPGVAVFSGADDHIFLPERLLQGLKTSEDIDYMVVTESLHGLNRRRKDVDTMIHMLSMTEARKVQRPVVSSLVGRLLLPTTLPVERAARLRSYAAAVPIAR